MLELVKSGRVRLAMDSARQAANQIVAHQTELLRQAESINKNLTSVTRTTITVGNVIALGLILATAFAAQVDRKKRDAAEQALVAEQAELAAVVDSAFEGIVTLDQQYRIRLINPAAAKLLGSMQTLVIGGHCSISFPRWSRSDAVSCSAAPTLGRASVGIQHSNHATRRWHSIHR